MRARHFELFLALPLLLLVVGSVGTGPITIQAVFPESPRRILHQPLFPAVNPPPPMSNPSPTPPPPTPEQPFFQENTPPPNQIPPPPPPPPPPSSIANSSSALPAATQPAPKPAKKVAIAVSVGIVTLGMLSALAFFLYKHRAKHPTESQKLVGENSRSLTDESRRPPSSLLYIGTVEPTAHRTEETNGAIASPYHKLNPSLMTLDRDRYRPSPELQPLPPLTKPPTHECSPSSAMSSSDDDHDEECRETTFHTPSAMSSSTSTANDDNFYTPVSRQSQLNGTSPSSSSSAAAAKAKGDVSVTTTTSVPHSKRTSPKSRFSVSPTADTSGQIVPSKKLLPPSPPPLPPENQPKERIAPFSQRARFSAPPPPPNLAVLRSITNSTTQVIPIPTPPPPPPPPPQFPVAATQSRQRKSWFSSETSVSSMRSHLPQKQRPQLLNSKSTMPLEEVDKGVDSSERVEVVDVEGVMPKLKPLHWDKVRATSDRATVWDQLKSSSFQLNEDMMESLFGCKSTNVIQKEATRKPVITTVEQENRVLDPKKSQNIAILLRALNVTRDEVAEALLDGIPEGLGAELLETLVKMAPTKEEEIKLRDYNGDITKLGSAERFLKVILDIPFAFKRVEAMLYRTNFDAEVKYLRKSYQTLEAASEELKNSQLFLKLLQAVLRTGNRMNVGTNRGDARAFKLDTLLKLVDIKGTDGKTTLLHFVVQEIIRSEGASADPLNESLQNQVHSKTNDENFTKQGLQVVAGLSRELGDVKKAAGMDSDVLSSYVSKLELGLEKVRLVLQYEIPNMQGKFFESMKLFLREADEEILKIKADERKALSHVKEVTEYFHGNVAKEEAHPLRIFMIVRDFLSILDQVCKEVGRMQDRAVGSARSFRIPATASLPVLNRFKVRQDESSDEESLSP